MQVVPPLPHSHGGLLMQTIPAHTTMVPYPLCRTPDAMICFAPSRDAVFAPEWSSVFHRERCR